MTFTTKLVFHFKKPGIVKMLNRGWWFSETNIATGTAKTAEAPE